MFEGISGTQQALLYLAIIMACGFTAFVLFAIVPLVKIIKDQNDTMKVLSGNIEKHFSMPTESE